MSEGRGASRRRRTHGFRALVVLPAVSAAYVAASSPSGSAQAGDPLDKIEAKALAELAANGEATFWVLMREQADLAAATTMSSDARGQFVYDRLTSVAETSQAGARAVLDARKASSSPTSTRASSSTTRPSSASTAGTPAAARSTTTTTGTTRRACAGTRRRRPATTAPGVYDATLLLQSSSARRPSIPIPVRLIVPAYRQGVNAGGGASTDVAEGDRWAADQAHRPGGWGYVTRGTTAQTTRAIAGTLDDPLYQDLRRGMAEYRFGGLPSGIYQVELRFAELSNAGPGSHLFGVKLEGSSVLDDHDIVSDAGATCTADDHTFYLAVTDGTLNVHFVEHPRFGRAEIAALRVTHRPDR